MSLTQLRLNLPEGSVSFAFTPQSARDLQAALAGLMESLKTVALQSTPGSGSRPTPQVPLEYRYTGDIFLELFCNPNIWASPYAAKVLITLRDDRIRLSTEADLTQVIADVNQYLEQVD